MSASKKGVWELQQPVEGERSPIASDGIASAASEHDRADMLRLGRDQQLKVGHGRDTVQSQYQSKLTMHGVQHNFRPISTLGLTTVIMCTWLGMIA